MGPLSSKSLQDPDNR